MLSKLAEGSQKCEKLIFRPTSLIDVKYSCGFLLCPVELKEVGRSTKLVSEMFLSIRNIIQCMGWSVRAGTLSREVSLNIFHESYMKYSQLLLSEWTTDSHFE